MYTIQVLSQLLREVQQQLDMIFLMSPKTMKTLPVV